MKRNALLKRLLAVALVLSLVVGGAFAVSANDIAQQEAQEQAEQQSSLPQEEASENDSLEGQLEEHPEGEAEQGGQDENEDEGGDALGNSQYGENGAEPSVQEPELVDGAQQENEEEQEPAPMDEEPQAPQRAGARAFGLAPDDDAMKFLAPLLDVDKTELLTGQSETGFINVSPKDGFTYSNLEIVLKATNLTIVQPSNANPQMDSYVVDKDQGLYGFSFTNLMGTGSYLTVAEFYYSFPTNTTAPGDFGTLELYSISSDGIELDQQAIEEISIYARHDVTAEVNPGWRMEISGDFNFELDPDTQAKKVVPLPNPNGRDYWINVVPSPSYNQAGYAHAVRLAFDFVMEFPEPWRMPQEIADALRWQNFTMDEFEELAFGPVRLVNHSGAQLTIDVVRADPENITLRCETDTMDYDQGEFIHGPGFEIFFDAFYTENGVIPRDIIPNYIYDNTVMYFGITEIEAEYFYGDILNMPIEEELQAVRVKKEYSDLPSDEQSADEYLQDIYTETLNAYFTAKDDSTGFYGLKTQDLGEHYLARPYMTNGALPGDTTPNTQWFEINGLENTKPIGFDALSFDLKKEDGTLEFLGFMPTQFAYREDAAVEVPVQRVTLAGSNVVLYEDDGTNTPTVNTAYLDEYEVNIQGEGFRKVYMLKNAAYGLLVEFENISALQADKNPTAVQARPRYLVRATALANNGVVNNKVGLTVDGKMVLLIDGSAQNPNDHVTLENGTGAWFDYYTALPENYALNKGFENVTARETGRYDSSIYNGDMLEYTVSFALKEDTVVAQGLLLVDEALAGLVLADDLTATVTINHAYGSQLELKPEYNPWTGTAYTNPENTVTVYKGVTPVRGSMGLEQGQMAFFLAGTILQGDTVDITYQATVDNTGGVQSVSNVVYAVTGSNGTWVANGGTLPPTWVPGDADGYQHGQSTGGIAKERVYAAIDIGLYSENDKLVTALGVGERATLVVQAGLPFSDLDGEGPAVLVELANVLAASGLSVEKLATINGELQEAGATLLTGYELYYFDMDGNAVDDIAHAAYILLDCDTMALARNAVIRLNIDVVGVLPEGETVEASDGAAAWFTIGTPSSGTRFDGELVGLKTAPWGNTREEALTAADAAYTLLQRAGAGLPGTVSSVSTTQAYLAETGEYVVDFMKQSPRSGHYSLSFINYANTGRDRDLPVTEIVDILPLGLTLKEVTVVDVRTSHFAGDPVTTPYHLEPQLLEDGRWMVKYVFDEPVIVVPGLRLFVEYSFTVDETAVDASEVEVKSPGPASAYIASNDVRKKYFGEIVKSEEETQQDAQLWWVTPGISHRGSRATYSLTYTYMPKKLVPGLRLYGDTSYLHTQGGTNATLSMQLYNSSSAETHITDYKLAVILPHGFTYDKDASVIAEPEILYNDMQQQVLVWTPDDLGIIERGKSISTSQFTVHIDDSRIGDTTVNAVLIPKGYISGIHYLGSSNYAGAWFTAAQLEDSHWLAGTGIGGQSIMAQRTINLYNSSKVTAKLNVGVNGQAAQQSNKAEREDILTYTMSLNNGGNAQSGISFLNVMPRVGDTTVLRRASSAADEDNQRGSEWAPELVGTDSFRAYLDGTELYEGVDYTVWFSAKVPVLRNEWLAGGTHWQSSWDLDVMGQPAAFKVDFADNISVGKDKSLVLEWDMQVPADMQMEQWNAVAVNSMGYRISEGQGNVFNEPEPALVFFETDTGLTMQVTKEYVYQNAPSFAGDVTFELELYALLNGNWRLVNLNDYVVDGASYVNWAGDFAVRMGPGGSMTVTIEGLREGIYKVVEPDIDTTLYEVKMTHGEVLLNSETQPHITVTNTRIPRAVLRMEKTVVDGTGAPTGGSFTLELQAQDDGGEWQKVDLNDWFLAGPTPGVSVNAAGQMEVQADAVDGTQTYSGVVNGLPVANYRLVEVAVDKTNWIVDDSAALLMNAPPVVTSVLNVTNTRRDVPLVPEKPILEIAKVLADDEADPDSVFYFQLAEKVGNSWVSRDLNDYVQDPVAEGLDITGVGLLKLTLANGAKAASATLRSLPEGTWRVTEVEVDAAKYTVAYTSTTDAGGNTVVLVDDGQEKVTVTNTRKAPPPVPEKPELVISKALVDGEADPDTVFYFKVERQLGPDSWALCDLNDTMPDTAAGVGVTQEGYLELTLADAQDVASAAIRTLPAGTYRVVEVNHDEAKYEVSYQNTENAASNVVVLADDQQAAVRVTNTRKPPLPQPEPPELVISKALADGENDPDTEFYFKVERQLANGRWSVRSLNDFAPEPGTGVSVTADGLLKLTLADAEDVVSATVRTLPAGTYRVVEVEYDGDKYEVSYKGGTGQTGNVVALAEDTQAAVRVTNTRKEKQDPPPVDPPPTGSSSSPSSESVPSSVPSSSSSSSSSLSSSSSSSSSVPSSSSSSTPSIVPPTPEPGSSSSSSSSSSSAVSSSSSTVSSSSSSSSLSSTSVAPDSSSSTSEGGETPLPDAGNSEAPPPTDPPATSRIVVDENGGYGEPGDDYYIEPNGTTRLFGTEIPTGGLGSIGGWSLVNLILGLIALFSAVIVAAHTLAVRSKLHRDVADDDLEEDEVALRKRSIVRKLFAAGAGLLPLLFFIIAEKLTIPIVFSKWTPYVFALVLLHFALLAFAGYRRKHKEKPQEPQAKA